MARQYAFLAFQPGVDWRDVNPNLLTRLNRLGMALGKTISVVSGYRSYAKQKYLWDHAKELGLVRSVTVAAPGHSEHNKGLALDAQIGGKPIGNVVSEKQMHRFGISWLHGDPVHVHFFGNKAAEDVKATATAAPTQAAPDANQQAAQDLVAQVSPPGSPPDPAESLPGIYAPGSVPAEGGYGPRHIADTWRLIASQPLSSPESQYLAQNAQLGTGGQ